MTLVLVPWRNPAEFLFVAESFLSGTETGLKLCLRRFQIWDKKVDRLPVGVEVSIHIIEALLLSNDEQQRHGSKLASGQALTRFINVAGDLGEKCFGSQRLTEAADRLGVPRWLVQLRNYSAHRELPDGHDLEEGLKAALKWICLNYWIPEMNQMRNFMTGDHQNQFEDDLKGKLSGLFDCFGYLKLYHLWGTKKLGDLDPDDHGEVLRHIRNLWDDFSLDKNVKRKAMDEVKPADGAQKLLSEVQKFIRKSKVLTSKCIFEALLDSETIIPGQEFLDSLCYESDHEKLTDLPKILVQIWSKMLRRIFNPDLLTVLYDFMSRESDSCKRKMAYLWISEMIKALEQPKQKSGSASRAAYNNKRRKTEEKLDLSECCESGGADLKDFADHCLTNPCRMLDADLLERIFNIRKPNLNHDQKERFKILVDIWNSNNDQRLGNGTEKSVLTLDSLLTDKHESDDAEDQFDPENPWSKADSQWKELPIGYGLDSLNSADVDANSDSNFDKEEKLIFDPEEMFQKNSEIFALDWNSLLFVAEPEEPADSVPHFYSVGKRRRIR